MEDKIPIPEDVSRLERLREEIMMLEDSLRNISDLIYIDKTVGALEESRVLIDSTIESILMNKYRNLKRPKEDC